MNPIGDFFSAILSKTNIHTNVVKGYTLPNTTNSDSLVIPISVSGNSAETISILKSAHKIGCQVMAFSSGGYINLPVFVTLGETIFGFQIAEPNFV